MRSKNNSGIDENVLRKSIWKVAIPIIIIGILMTYYQINSVDHVQEEYFKRRQKEFKGEIIKLKEEGDFSRANRYLLLDNYHKILLTEYLFDRLSIGDSVEKIKDSDSLIFRLKNGQVMILDDLKFYRDKYEKLILK